MKRIENVFFRVDANQSIGSGHLVRCEMIADNIKKKYLFCNIFFVVKAIPDSFKKRLEAKRYNVTKLVSPVNNELKEQVDLLKQHPKAALIVDSDEPLYYTKEYQLTVREVLEQLTMITFYNDSHFYSDVIHNQNIMAPELAYSCEPYTQKLLGTKYVVLKECYKELADKKCRHTGKKYTVMLTFGGSDKPNRTALVLEALQHLQDRISKVIVVLGAMYQNREKLEESFKQTDLNIELYQDTDKMPELMAECDIALTSGGLTSWELGALGVLNIILPNSEREVRSATYLDQNKYAYSIKNFFSKGAKEIADTIADILEDIYLERVAKLRKAINVDGVNDLIKSIFSD